MGADPVTVSCDTKFVHLAWHTVEKEIAEARFQMGADPTGRLSREFGVYLDEAGVPLRGTFVISPEGVLLFSEVNFLNVGRNFDELMRKFKAALYVSKKDEGIPSTWNDEGDLTLKPSERMVGKVHEALRNQGEAP